MNCSNCSLPVEADAAFCGNCGHQLKPASGQQAVQEQVAVPAYALANPQQHVGENQAMLALMLGMMGTVGALFMPVLGIGLGALGWVMGTLARSRARRLITTSAFIASSLAILLGLAAWVYAAQSLKNKQAKAEAESSAQVITASELSTPCYSLDFTEKLNIKNSADSCSLQAYNGQTINTSTDAYKVFASQHQVTDVNSFTAVAKLAVEKDITDNLPEFVINSQRVGAFAGSPAYIVQASDPSGQVSIIEAAVYHQTSRGDNVFIIVHALNDKSANLSILESQWQWK